MMTNKSESKTKRLFKLLFNPRGWVDYDRVRASQKYIIRMCSVLFVPREQASSESFNEAQSRFKLSEDDLVIRKNSLFRLSLLMILIAFLLFMYVIYNLIHGYFVASFLSIVVMMLALALAFRYHFWFFQIQQKKLGCSFKEWYEKGLLGKHHE